METIVLSLKPRFFSNFSNKKQGEVLSHKNNFLKVINMKLCYVHFSHGYKKEKRNLKFRIREN